MPNRIIKESTFTSERISALSDFQFRLWVGLITQADDAGRGDARPASSACVTNAYMHNVMIRRYGQPERYGDEVVYIMLPDTEEAEEKALEAETYHLKPTSHTKDGKDGVYRAYILMRGSSTYNTEEFSRLLDGLLSECKEAGIRIMTDREER